VFLIANYVDCVQPLGALLALKIYRVSLVQCLEPILLNRREMHKNVFACGALNETIPLGAVKPFHYTTFGHKDSPSFIIFRMRLWEGGRDRSGSFESVRQVLLRIQKMRGSSRCNGVTNWYKRPSLDIADPFPHPSNCRLEWDESDFVMAGFSQKRKKNLFAIT
jgi:hypothetical protein